MTKMHCTKFSKKLIKIRKATDYFSMVLNPHWLPGAETQPTPCSHLCRSPISTGMP